MSRTVHHAAPRSFTPPPLPDHVDHVAAASALADQLQNAAHQPIRTVPLHEAFGTPANAQAAELAQQATMRPAAPAISEKTVAQFQASNTQAVAALQAQNKELDAVQNKIDALSPQNLTAPSQLRLAALSKAVAAKRQGIAAELHLRQAAASSLEKSIQPQGKLHQDAAVAQALGALTHHQQSHALTPKEVAGFHAILGKKIHTESEYDKPGYMRYKTQYGPGYKERDKDDSRYSLGASPGWSRLIQSKKVTSSEQKIISRMSENEGGRTDALQGYDSEIVSLGAMQKTANSRGHGELPKQIEEFSQTNPEKYKTLFADKGWTVERTGKGKTSADYTISFKDPTDPKAPKLTGAKLRAYIHQKDPQVWEKTLKPLLAAGRDIDFEQKQIADYQSRLNEAINKVPRSYEKHVYTQPISAYVTSEQAVALVLDQDVNRPGHVAGDFGTALDSFYSNHPQAPKDPQHWTAEQHQEYEPIIVANYEQARAVSKPKKNGMTKPENRAKHLTNPQSGLSATPGSFVRTHIPLGTEDVVSLGVFKGLAARHKPQPYP